MSADDSDRPTAPEAAPPPAAPVADRYFAEVYYHLRALAGSYLRRERPGHTLQPTALVNEAYLRLRTSAVEDLSDRGHFMAIAARAMRQVLIDSARHQRAGKRQGERVTLDEGLLGRESQAIDLLALDDALAELSEIDEQRARIVELRFFTGLSCEETAEILGVSLRTVMRRWRSSRAFLLQRVR